MSIVVVPPAPVDITIVDGAVIDITVVPPAPVDITIDMVGVPGPPGVPLADVTVNPVSPVVGAMWFRGDLDEIRYWDGTVVQIIPRLFVGTTAPTSPQVNDLWVDTT